MRGIWKIIRCILDYLICSACMRRELLDVSIV